MEQVPKPDDVVITASWTFAALATISFGLRLWCRMYRFGTLWWDDLALGISVVTIIFLFSRPICAPSSNRAPSSSLRASDKVVEVYLSKYLRKTHIQLVILLSAVFSTAMFLTGWSTEPVPHGLPVAFYIASGSCGAIAAGLSKTAYMVTLLRLTTEAWTWQLLWIFVASLNLVLWLGVLSSWTISTQPGVQITANLFVMVILLGCDGRDPRFISMEHIMQSSYESRNRFSG